MCTPEHEAGDVALPEFELRTVLGRMHGSFLVGCRGRCVEFESGFALRKLQLMQLESLKF